MCSQWCCRGEYWRLLLPGSYQLRASHRNKFGVLESELTDIEVLENTNGETEAQTVDLLCRLRLEDTFLVTGVRKGFCRLLDNTEVKDEVKEIFRDCRITQMEIFEAECKKVPDDPATVQVAFLVKIVMDHGPMLKFFAERWNETEVRRPSCDFEAVWSISMSRTFPRSCCGVSYAIKNQLVASKAPY